MRQSLISHHLSAPKECNIVQENKKLNGFISNCVINLSPDKSQAFREAHRVLKPAERLVVSDTVSEKTLPDEIRQDPDTWAGCLAGALERHEYLSLMTCSFWYGSVGRQGVSSTSRSFNTPLTRGLNSW